MEIYELQFQLSSISSFLRFSIMVSSISHLSNNPLFSCIFTLYTLILLYFPRSLQLILSPVLILAAALLLFLLRLGALQRLQSPNPVKSDTQQVVESSENEDCDFGVEDKYGLLAHDDKWVEPEFDPNPSRPDFEESFVEWNVKAPLEVIYEAYEGEEDGQNEMGVSGLEKYPSLSMYYPETDSDSSSDGGFSVTKEWDSPDSVYFRWEEEDRDGLLIEIALDHDNEKKQLGFGSDIHGEEDNLIEIDISPHKND